MRWRELFDDLEGRLAAEGRRGLDLEVADRTRRERALVGLHERLLATQEEEGVVEVLLRPGTSVPGQVVDVGADWFVLGDGTAGGGGVLVPLAAVVQFAGLSRHAATERVLPRRFGFGHALRGLSRDRAVVTVLDVTGGETTGTIDAVGADLLDVSEHPADLPRRPRNVRSRRSIPFAAVSMVRRH